jgi:predicted esterase
MRSNPWSAGPSPRRAWPFALAAALAATQGWPLGPGEAAGTDPGGPPKGEVVPRVACAEKPEQTYALYLPSRYASDNRWPIVYILEPAARGPLPVEAMKGAAEKYGFILAASNNSRNGPLAPSVDALAAMWADTHARFSIDDRRIYFAGFSGGARMASHLARECKCTHGVFLNGAGLVGGGPVPKDLAIPVFATVGESDFNYSEMVRLDAQLDAVGVPHVLRRFDGPHQWAPPEVWDEALAWTSLLEMKDGRRERDEAVIRAELAAELSRARRREEGEPYLALRDYQTIVATFQGLADTADAASRVMALAHSKVALESAKREQKEIEKEESAAAAARRALAALKSPGGDPASAWRDARDEVERLRSRFARGGRPEEKRALTRAHAAITAQLIETGIGLLADKDYETARRYLELGTLSEPAALWARISLARCLMALGDRKGAIRELARAKEGGAELAGLPERLPELQPLSSDAAFLDLAASSTSPAPLR